MIGYSPNIEEYYMQTWSPFFYRSVFFLFMCCFTFAHIFYYFVLQCNGVYPNLFTFVLCIHAVAFTKESVKTTFFSSINFLIVTSQLAWFLSLMPFDHGLYAGPYLKVIPCFAINSSILIFTNSPSLLRKIQHLRFQKTSTKYP